jgi:hypothetical protein
MSHHSKLEGQRLVTPDGLMHRPFDCDGDGLVLSCDLAARDVRYADLRRFSYVALVVSEKLTCLGCLAAGSPDDAEKQWDDVFNKRMEDV